MIRPYGKLLSRPFHGPAAIPTGKSMLRLQFVPIGVVAWTAEMRPCRFGGLSTCRVRFGGRFSHTLAMKGSALTAGRLRSRV